MTDKLMMLFQATALLVVLATPAFARRRRRYKPNGYDCRAQQEQLW